MRASNKYQYYSSANIKCFPQHDWDRSARACNEMLNAYHHTRKEVKCEQFSEFVMLHGGLCVPFRRYLYFINVRSNHGKSEWFCGYFFCIFRMCKLRCGAIVTLTNHSQIHLEYGFHHLESSIIQLDLTKISSWNQN